MFVVSKAELAPALGVIRAGLIKSIELPIRSHVLMRVEGGRLKLVSDSSVLHAETSVPAKGNDMAIAVPGEIADIVDRLDGEISFEPAESMMTIKSGRTRLRLPCLAAEDFPLFQGEEFSLQTEVAAPNLLRAMSFVEPTIAKKDVRQYLTGMFFEWQQDALTLVGADGFMMGLARIATDKAMTGNCIVPLKTIHEVIRVIKAQDVKLIHIAKGPQLIRFTIGSCEITSKLIDGNFPNWSTILAGAAKAPDGCEVTVSREALGSALERISLIAKDQKRFLFQFSKNKVVLSTSNPNQSAEEPVQAESSGEGQVWMNKSQLQITTQRLTGDKVVLHIGGPERAIRYGGLVKSECYVLMPMRD